MSKIVYGVRQSKITKGAVLASLGEKGLKENSELARLNTYQNPTFLDLNLYFNTAYTTHNVYYMMPKYSTVNLSLFTLSYQDLPLLLLPSVGFYLPPWPIP